MVVLEVAGIHAEVYDQSEDPKEQNAQKNPPCEDDREFSDFKAYDIILKVPNRENVLILPDSLPTILAPTKHSVF